MRHNKSSLRGQVFHLPNERTNERAMSFIIITLIQTGYFDAFAASSSCNTTDKIMSAGVCGKDSYILF